MADGNETHEDDVPAEPPSTPPMPTIELDTPDRPRPQRTPSTPMYSTPVRSTPVRPTFALSSGSSSHSRASASRNRNRTPASAPGSAILQGNRAVLLDASADGLTRVPWVLCGSCHRALSGPGRITGKYRVGYQQGGCRSGIMRCPGEPGEGGCKHPPTTKNVPDAPQCSVCRGLGVVVHPGCRGGNEVVDRCGGDAVNGPHNELWVDAYDRTTAAGMKNEFEIWEDPEEREMEKGKKKAKRSAGDDGEVFDE